MKQIIFATGNQNKLKEIKAILPNFDIISATPGHVNPKIRGGSMNHFPAQKFDTRR